MRIKACGVSVFAFLTLIGCSEPKLDMKDNDTAKNSMEKVKESLPPEKREEFENSIKIITFSGLNFADLLNGKETTKDLEQKVKGQLDGKTADEVITEAKKIRLEREAREKEQALQEITELEKKSGESEKNKSELKKVVISKSRFYKEPQQFGSDKPIIAITVKNGTSIPISRAYFSGVIASPGRAVPWLKEEFNYEISGGLEVGEEQSWGLAPNQFSEWGKVEVPADAIFTVEVVRVDGPDGKPALDVAQFTERDKERLSELKAKFK